MIEARTHSTIQAQNCSEIATLLGVPEMMTIGEGTGARTTVDPLDHMMFSEEIKEHVK